MVNWLRTWLCKLAGGHNWSKERNLTPHRYRIREKETFAHPGHEEYNYIFEVKKEYRCSNEFCEAKKEEFDVMKRGRFKGWVKRVFRLTEKEEEEDD